VKERGIGVWAAKKKELCREIMTCGGVFKNGGGREGGTIATLLTRFLWLREERRQWCSERGSMFDSDRLSRGENTLATDSSPVSRERGKQQQDERKRERGGDEKHGGGKKTPGPPR